MKITTLLWSLLTLPLISNAQNKTFSIGTNSPNANAAFQVESPTSNQGVILTRLTTVQRMAMTLTATDVGLQVYDSDRKGIFIWDGAAWTNGGIALPFSGSIGSTPAALDVTNTGTGAAFYGESNNASAFSAIVGYARTGSANAISGLSDVNTSAGGYSILGQNDGLGYSGYFLTTNNANTNPAVYSETNGTGDAGFFVNTNTTSETRGVVGQINSNTGGTAVSGHSQGTAGYGGAFVIGSSSNNYPALLGTTAGTGAAVHGVTSTGWTAVYGRREGGTNGYAGNFEITNAANTYPALVATTVGTGAAGTFVNNNTTSGTLGAYGEIKSNVGGAALRGSSTGTAGHGGYFEVSNAANNYPTVQGVNKGTGTAGAFYIENPANGNSTLFSSTNGTGTCISAETATGWTAIYGKSASSTTGHAGYFEISNASNSSSALKAITAGNGHAGWFEKSYVNPSGGSGFPTLVVTHTGFEGATGQLTQAATFSNSNPANTGAPIGVSNYGNGSLIFGTHYGSSGNMVIFEKGSTNVMRINIDGKGFFNGGTQNSGADVAELFDVEGTKESYEPGDVLVISESTDRTVEQSSEANSTKVVGVYATKPGVTLTEKGIEENLDELVPMGVIGVIPTKVCLENGPIKRGDLLVTSSKKGHAMKAVSPKGDGMFPAGTVLGKALENFDGRDAGIIKVLVNVK